MASVNTHNPVRVFDADLGRDRNAGIYELDILQGYWPGMSGAHGRVDLEYSESVRLIGNAFHYELVRVFQRLPLLSSTVIGLEIQRTARVFHVHLPL